MTKPIQIIEQLMNPECNVAKVIEDAWKAESEDFWIGLDLSLNPTIDFKVERVPEIDDEDDGTGNFSFNQFHNLAVALAQDPLDADARYKLLSEAAMVANVKEWNLWYRRILTKSLHKYLPMEEIRKQLTRLTTG